MKICVLSRMRVRPFLLLCLALRASVLQSSADNAFQSVSVVAQGGQATTTGETLSTFRPEVSINDSGRVAFGTNAGINALLIGQVGSAPQIIGTARQTAAFSPMPHINNAFQVAGREVVTSPSASLVRIWNAVPSPYTIASGSSDPTLSHNLNLQNAEQALDYAAVQLPTIANDGGFGYVGQSATGTVSLYYNPSPNPPTGSNTTEVFLTDLVGGGFRPMTADGGRIVIHNDLGGSRAVNIYRATAAPVQVAAVGTNWVSLGTVPGISDDGNVVTFAGELSANGAAMLNQSQVGAPQLKPGLGYFASIDNGGQRLVVRLAGLSGNGLLDPGENWNDLDKDGTVDVGEDIGGFSSLNTAMRIGANLAFPLSPGEAGPRAANYRFAFIANETTSIAGVYSGVIGSSQRGIISQPSAVAKVGQTDSGLPGPYSSFSLHDPVNNSDEIAFWANVGAEAVVRVNRSIDPIRQFQSPFGESLYAPGKLASFIQKLQGNPSHPDASQISALQNIAARGAYNIDAVGCYLSSFSMALRKLGLSTDTPVEIHAKLAGITGGITPIENLIRKSDGTIRYRAGSDLPVFNGADPSLAILQSQYGTHALDVGTDVTKIRSALANGNPVLLNIKNGGHWILAIGINPEGKIETIDPGSSFRDTAYTDVQLANLKLKNSRVLFEGAGTAFAVAQTQSPIELVITAPSGLRLGVNPNSGSSFSEIPSSSYAPLYPTLDPDDEYSDSDLLIMSPFLPHVAFLNGLEMGQYRIDVYGTAGGDFALSFNSFDANGGSSLFQTSGVIQAGQTLSFFTQVIPEPRSIGLLLIGILLLLSCRRAIRMGKNSEANPRTCERS